MPSPPLGGIESSCWGRKSSGEELKGKGRREAKREEEKGMEGEEKRKARGKRVGKWEVKEKRIGREGKVGRQK